MMEHVGLILFVLLFIAVGFGWFGWLKLSARRALFAHDRRLHQRKYRLLRGAAALYYWASLGAIISFLALREDGKTAPMFAVASVLFAATGYALRCLTRWATFRPPALRLVPRPEPEERVPYWFPEDNPTEHLQEEQR